jgi:hypothetical protein
MKTNIKISHDDTERANDIQLERIEICVDPNDYSRVWIYMLDDTGDRVEGAEFSMNHFMACVRKFYDDNF